MTITGEHAAPASPGEHLGTGHEEQQIISSLKTLPQEYREEVPSGGSRYHATNIEHDVLPVEGPFPKYELGAAVEQLPGDESPRLSQFTATTWDGSSRTTLALRRDESGKLQLTTTVVGERATDPETEPVTAANIGAVETVLTKFGAQPIHPSPGPDSGS